MKLFVLAFAFYWISLAHVASQSIRTGTFASSYFSAKTTTVRLQYSVGEISVKKMDGDQFSLLQGSVAALADSVKRSPLALEESSSQQTILVYPNPFQNELFVAHTMPLDLRVYDLAGNLVDEQKAIGQKLTLNFLPPGCYIFQLHDSHGLYKTYKLNKI